MIYLEIVHVCFVIYLLLQTAILFPESPQYNYSKENFDEAREDLDKVAKINGIENYNSKNFEFDVEYENKKLAEANMNLKEGEKPTEKREGGNVYGLTNGEFIKNVIILSLLFTCFSFSFWLTDFQAEYLGTDIFILFYANGVVCIISGQINLYLFPLMGMKWLIISVQTITLIAASYIVLVQ